MPQAKGASVMMAKKISTQIHNGMLQVFSSRGRGIGAFSHGLIPRYIPSAAVRTTAPP